MITKKGAALSTPNAKLHNYANTRSAWQVRLQRWEVIVTEYHLVRIFVVLWEQTFLSEEVVGLQNHWLPDLQWENTLVTVRLHHRGAEPRAVCQNFSSKVADRLLDPFLTRKSALLVFWNVSHNGKL